jgi:hypothetical protein
MSRKLARPERFELPTPRFVVWCSIATPKGAGPLKTIPTISADTALRLSKYFGTTPEFWMNLQSRYELEEAIEEIGEDLEEIEVPERAFG